MKNRVATGLVLGLALSIAFWLIWSRLRIIVWVQTPWYVLLGAMMGLALIIFLALDHLLNRSR